MGAFLILCSLLLTPFALRPAPALALTQFSLSDLLKDGEGSVGVQGGMLSKRLSMTGSFGNGAARSRYPVEAVLNGGSGGYGFTERLDAFLNVARASAAEVDTLIIVARELGYLDTAEAGSVRESIASISKMLSARIRSLNSSPPATDHSPR